MKHKTKAIAASYLISTLDYATLHQLFDTQALLTKIGVNREQLNNSRYYLSLEQYIAIVDAVLEHKDHCDLVAYLVAQAEITQHGLLGLLVLCGINLRQALMMVLRFYRIQSRLINLEFIEINEQAIIRVFPCGDLKKATATTLELVLLIIAKNKQQLIGQQSILDHIELTVEKTPEYACYQPLLSININGNQPYNQLVFPRAQLDIRLKSAHPATSALLEQQCEALLLQLGDDDTTLIDKLQQLFRQQALPFPSLSALAHQLHTTPRTLTRRLKQANSSYQQLLDQERITRTKLLLQQTEMPVTDIAVQLYFTDASHLTKLFKRDVGMTPLQFREQETSKK